MDAECIGCGKGHNRNGNSSAVHVDSSAQRNGYGVSILIKSPFFTGFHIYRDIRCGASRKECGNGTLFQAFEN